MPDPCQWRKSSLKGPHEYVMAECFPEIVAKIRKEGVIKMFRGRPFKYWYAEDGYRYWEVGRILNRAKTG